MKLNPILLILSMFFALIVNAQVKSDVNKQDILNKDDYEYLKELTKSILDSSRIYPGQSLTAFPFGDNNTGGTLISPGGNYPSFWIRDYVMSLGSGFVTKEEQRHMLLLTASTQSNQTWITNGGSMIPFGAVADHIRVDNSVPIFFPGTYSHEEQGISVWGKTPPYGDQFLFIHMAYNYVKKFNDKRVLKKEINGIRLIDRMEIAFRVPPSHLDSHIVYTTDDFRGVDFGFRDVVTITGDLCYPSILKYRASNELARLFDMLGDKKKTEAYRSISEKIKAAIPSIFANENGMLRASTGKSNQPDVWSTALAVYFGVLDGRNREAACNILNKAYKNGTLAYKGNIRHVLTTDDFNDQTAWEGSMGGGGKNLYQNGAYWGTPTGWVCYAIAQVDQQSAKKLATEYIGNLRETDYRKGKGHGGPYEWIVPDRVANPLYLTTVSCPYEVFKFMTEK